MYIIINIEYLEILRFHTKYRNITNQMNFLHNGGF